MENSEGWFCMGSVAEPDHSANAACSPRELKVDKTDADLIRLIASRSSREANPRPRNVLAENCSCVRFPHLGCLTPLCPIAAWHCRRMMCLVRTHLSGCAGGVMCPWRLAAARSFLLCCPRVSPRLSTPTSSGFFATSDSKCLELCARRCRTWQPSAGL
eukprot:3406523-Rhodomonas_salina.2